MLAASLRTLASLIELRSFFFGAVCFAVLLILAYLTNPSENSFRTFLTEQSFRRHLTKVNDASETSHDSMHDPTSSYYARRDINASLVKAIAQKQASSNPTLSGQPIRFHFANRVSVSLQTPAHIIRSFGLFTAVVTPLVDTSSISTYATPTDDTKILPSASEAKMRGSWFIGAFGKWWIGGTVELSRRDIATLSTHERLEFKHGLCSIRPLDYGDAYEGLNVQKTVAAVNLKLESPKPKVESPVRQTVTPQSSRSSTPPPPSKTPANGRIRVKKPEPKSKKVLTVVETSHPVTHDVETLPLITDIMKQIADSQSAIVEHRSQLQTFQSNAFASHAALQATLDEHRARKRQEDALRSELKSKTKNLEDLKRQADALKREAEKRLKAAHASKDHLINRIEKLEHNIAALEARSIADDARAQRSQEDVVRTGEEVALAVAQKRAELKTAEELVATLSARTRELEETIANERVRLQRARDEAAARHAREQELYLSQQLSGSDENDLWYQTPASHRPPEPFIPYVLTQRRTATQPGESNITPLPQVSATTTARRPPSLTGLYGFDNVPRSGTDMSQAPALEPKEANGNRFSPFVPMDNSSAYDLPNSITLSTSSLLLPANLVSSIETESPLPYDNQRQLSPALDSPSSGGGWNEPSGDSKPSLSFPSSWSLPGQTNGFPDLEQLQKVSSRENAPVKESRKSWWNPRASPAKPKEANQSTAPKSSLNPEAKVFSPPSFLTQTLRSLNSGSKVPAEESQPVAPVVPAPTRSWGLSGLFSSRAFAPSPEEKKALERALGGSHNRSLDRIPLGGESGDGVINRLPISPFVVPPDSHIVPASREDGWDTFHTKMSRMV